MFNGDTRFTNLAVVYSAVLGALLSSPSAAVTFIPHPRGRARPEPGGTGAGQRGPRGGVAHPVQRMMVGQQADAWQTPNISRS
jgi:hypothetical protein